MSAQQKVFVTQLIPQAGLDVLTRVLGGYDINPEQRPLGRDELLARVAGREGIVSILTDRIDKAVMDAAGPQLKVISDVAVGYNNVDVPEATKRGIIVTNTPGVLTDATADIAFTLILMVARRAGEGERTVRAGKWTGWGILQFLGAEVSHRTLGIIGGGRIGQATARRALGFGMKILYASRSRRAEMDELGAEYLPMDRVLAESDFVSLHVPLNAETKHLIGKRELSLMKKSAFLINTARGPVVDEAALVDCLKSGVIAGAGLDVFENEPTLYPGLVDLENTVLLPHIGSATEETRGKMATMAAENCVAVLQGRKAPNAVN